jgi:hypothetical protein
MCARPDLWEPWVSNHPGPPGPRRVRKGANSRRCGRRSLTDAPNKGAQRAPVALRYDGLKKENSLLSTKLGNLDCRGEDSGSASFPQYGDSHGSHRGSESHSCSAHRFHRPTQERVRIGPPRLSITEPGCRSDIETRSPARDVNRGNPSRGFGINNVKIRTQDNLYLTEAPSAPAGQETARQWVPSQHLRIDLGVHRANSGDGVSARCP